MASQETIQITQMIDKFYEEMREVVPNFKTNAREHMLIVAAISLALKEAKKG